MKRLKELIIYAVINILSFYLLPLLVNGMSSRMLIPMIAIPAISVITAFIYGWRTKKSAVFGLMIAVLYVPTIFIYESSTVIYAIIYTVASLVAAAVGSKLSEM